MTLLIGARELDHVAHSQRLAERDNHDADLGESPGNLTDYK